MAANKKSVQVAILDDYQDVASKILSNRLPDVQFDTYPETLNAVDPDQRAALIKRLKDYEIISTMRERTAFPPEVLNSLPKLKLILTTGPANASISLPTCKEKGILVVGTKGARQAPIDATTQVLGPSLQATAEQTLALMLGVTKLIPQNSTAIANGGWQTGFVTGLAGKTLGVIGLGKIGGQVARMAVLGLGMKVIAWSSSLNQSKADEAAAKFGVDKSAIKVAESKLELCREADIISLHYVLSDRSRGMIGKEELSAMKPTGVLINTSRGGLIDEPALLETLKQGKIRGVGLDVFTVEPFPKDSEWRTTRWGENGAGYAVLSPHMGYAEEAVMKGWYEEQADCLADWLGGKTPGNVISPKE